MVIGQQRSHKGPPILNMQTWGYVLTHLLTYIVLPYMNISFSSLIRRLYTLYKAWT